MRTIKFKNIDIDYHNELYAQLVTFSDFGEQVIFSCFSHNASIESVNIRTENKPIIKDDFVLEGGNTVQSIILDEVNGFSIDVETFSMLLDSYNKNYCIKVLRPDIVYIVVSDTELDLKCTEELLLKLKEVDILSVFIIYGDSNGIKSRHLKYIDLATTFIDSRNGNSEFSENISKSINNAVSAVLSCHLAHSNTGFIGVDFADVCYVLEHSPYLRIARLCKECSSITELDINNVLDEIDDEYIRPHVKYILISYYTAVDGNLSFDKVESISSYVNARYENLVTLVTAAPIVPKGIIFCDEIYILIGI